MSQRIWITDHLSWDVCGPHLQLHPACSLRCFGMIAASHSFVQAWNYLGWLPTAQWMSNESQHVSFDLARRFAHSEQPIRCDQSWIPVQQWLQSKLKTPTCSCVSWNFFSTNWLIWSRKSCFNSWNLDC